MNYAISFTDQERLQVASAFALIAQKLTNASPVNPQTIENKPTGTDHARAILSPAPTQQPAAAPARTPIEQRDRWARDRTGVEVPNPAGCEAADVACITKTEQKRNFWRVTWQNNGTGLGTANCFDDQLWPWIAKRKGEGGKTRLYLTRKGQYINIVGIRA